MENDFKPYTNLDVAHRLSALQLLGVMPLVRYKNITSDFELQLPDIDTISVPSKLQTSSENSRVEGKSSIDAKAVLAMTDSIDKPKTNPIVKDKFKNSLAASKKLQELFADLEQKKPNSTSENIKKSNDEQHAQPRQKQVVDEDTKSYPRLNLHIWQFSHKFLAISDCHFYTAEEENSAEKLLLNIFKALRLEWYLLGHYQFNLPDKNIPVSLLEELSWEDLAQKLELYLKGPKFEAIQPLNGVILFSDNNLQQVRQILHTKFNLYLSAPSIKNLLSKPVQKQLLWEKILHENWHKKLNDPTNFEETKD